jgi:subtilisin family serine protease
LETRVHPLITAEKGQGRIKIAILDTGIQLPAEANVVYEEQIKCHKSWLRGEPGNTGDESGKGDRDLDGHGTHCASLLLKVCPNAAIYVARVFRKRSERKGAVESIETQQAIADVWNPILLKCDSN